MGTWRVCHIQILSGSSKVIAPSHGGDICFSAGSLRPGARTFFNKSKYTAFIFLTWPVRPGAPTGLPALLQLAVVMADAVEDGGEDDVGEDEGSEDGDGGEEERGSR